jgi:hypothetical protein
MKAAEYCYGGWQETYEGETWLEKSGTEGGA